MPRTGYGYDAPAYDDPDLCRWTRLDESEAGRLGAGGDEWYVYGTPEQGAAEYAEVDVLAGRSGRITRVRLGEEVTYCTFGIAERLGVVYGGQEADGGGEDGGGGGSGDQAQNDFRWHPVDDGRAAGGVVSRWLVRGESGRAGGAVVVTSARTGRRTAVFLTREVGSAGGFDGSGLYEFVRC